MTLKKLEKELKWKPKTNIKNLVNEMIKSEMEILKCND